MKKLIIASTIACLMSTSAIANADMGMNMGDSMYIRAGGNLSFAKAIDSTKRDTYGISTDKLGEMVLNPTVAVGASVMDNVRAELSVTYFPDSKVYKDVPRNSKKSLVGGTDSADAVESNFALENSGFVALATGYVQIAEMGTTKIYALGGAGFSMVESKLESKNLSDGTAESVKFEDDLHFAYKVGIGASMEVATGTYLDTDYSYRDIGKPDTNSSNNTPWPFESRGSHNLSVSLRFNM